MKIGLILLAGGLSTRMGAGFSKVFHLHHEKPIAQYSLDCFLQIDALKEFVVVCSDDKRPIFKTPCKFASPGQERFLSVENGLRALSDDIDYALVHDAARPLITSRDVKSLIEIGVNCDGASLAGRVKNTMTLARNDQSVMKIIDRDGLWETFTPQLGRVKDLLVAIEVCKNLNEVPNDEMTLLHRIDLSPKLVEATFPNVKITYPTDLPLVCALLDQLHGSVV